jgi:hypothetical protein
MKRVGKNKDGSPCGLRDNRYKRGKESRCWRHRSSAERAEDQARQQAYEAEQKAREEDWDA